MHDIVLHQRRKVHGAMFFFPLPGYSGLLDTGGGSEDVGHLSLKGSLHLKAVIDQLTLSFPSGLYAITVISWHWALMIHLS